LLRHILVRTVAACVVSVSCIPSASAGANVWTTSGPPGGAFHDLEASTTDKNVYYAAYTHSLFRSTDGAVNWEALRHFDSRVSDIAVDPTDGSRLYVAVSREGVYRSEDGGQNFTKIVAAATQPIWSVAVGGSDGKTVYYSTDSGELFYSPDRGTTWTQRASTPSYLLRMMVEGAAGTTIMGISNDDAAVRRSVDGGATWSVLPVGGLRVYSILRVSSTRLVAGTAAGIYVSTDDGTTWAQRYVRGAWSIAAGATPGTLFATLEGQIYRSGDAGDTWQVLGSAPLSGTQITYTDTSPARLLLAGTQGVQISSDGGLTWLEAAASPIASSFPTMATTVAPSSRVYAFLEGESLFSTRADNGWKRVALPADLGFAEGVLAVKNGAPDTLYFAGWSQDLYRSADGGTTWSSLSGELAQYGTGGLAFDPKDPATMYASVVTGGLTPAANLYRSTDGGAHWAPLSTNLPAELYGRSIAIDRATPSRMYLGGYAGFSFGGIGGLYRSTDAGVTWSQAGYAGQDVWEVALDAGDANRVYAGTTSGLQVSTDAGVTFMPNAPLAAITGQTVTSVVADPTVAGTLWAATQDRGGIGSVPPPIFDSSFILRSVDGGQSWEILRANTDRPRWYVDRIVLDPNVPSLVYANTGAHGIGTFQIVNDPALSWTAEAGSVELRAENRGTFAATAARITAKLPAGLTGVTATPSAGTTCTTTSATLTCDIGAIRPGAAATVRVSYSPAGTAAPGVSATVAAHEQDSDESNNSVLAGEVVDLTVALAPSATSVTSGGTVTYSATVRNTGPHDASTASVTFTMGTGLALGASLPTGCTASGSKATCTVSALAAGASRELSVPVTATSTGSLTATAAVVAAVSAMDLDGTNDSATASITSNAPPPDNGGSGAGGGSGSGASGSNGGSGSGGGALDPSVLLIGLLAVVARTRRRMRQYR
jgi:uncharacterized repeat protein (TIGR01451 family)